MSKTIKLNPNYSSPIHFATTTVSTTVDVIINNRYWEVYGNYDLKTGTFTAERVSIFSLYQFCNENGITQDELNVKVNKLVKKALKG